MHIDAIRYNTTNNFNNKNNTQYISKHSLNMLTTKGSKSTITRAAFANKISKLSECGDSRICDAYVAICDSNGEVNKHAMDTFFALAQGKSTNIMLNLKNIFKEKHPICYIHNLIDLIECCKDKSGNHNKKTLILAEEFILNRLGTIKAEKYLNFCKDENGEIDDKRVDIIKDIRLKGYTDKNNIVQYIPNNRNEITQKRLDFYYFIMEKYKNKELEDDSLTLLREILCRTDEDYEDECITIIQDKFQYFLNEDKSVRYDCEYFTTKDPNISATNLRHLLPILQEFEKAEGKLDPAILKDKYGIISGYNIVPYLNLLAEGYDHDQISALKTVKEMKGSDGLFNTDFINFITGDNFKYFVKTKYNTHPSEVAREVLRIAKNPDKTTNWEVAKKIVKPVFLLFEEKGKELHKRGIESYPSNFATLWKDVYKNLSLINKYVKYKNGEFYKEHIEELSKLTDSNSIIKHLTGKPLEEMVEGKNLYKADDLLEILKELKRTDRLTPEYLNTPVTNDINLFWAIIDAPVTDENRKTYSEIMKILSEIEGINYNQKDSSNVSVLEKVIWAEKEELLDIIIQNSERLDYSPALDDLYNGVQSSQFKKKLKQLNLKFKDLNLSAELCSIKTFDRLKLQFNSPFCDKERLIEELFKIVKKQDGTIEPPDMYVYHLLDEYGGELSQDLFNKMAKWQITERKKRLE